MANLIYENDEVQLLHHAAESPYTLTTFAPRGSYANGQTFWGEPVARKAGINSYGVMAKRANWYPEAAMAPVVDAIVSRDRRPLATYGASMGAFAAIKYAGKLGADHVIAFTPQYSIDPRIVGPDDVFATNYVEALHRGLLVEPADCTVPAYLFFDPYVHQDRRHRDALSRVLARAVTIDIPMAGHGCVEVFSGTDLITQLFALCRAGNARGVALLTRAARRSSAVRVQTVATMLSRSHPAWAFRIAGRHRARFKPATLPKLFFVLATTFMDQGRFELADLAIAAALEHEPRNANLARRRSQINQRGGCVPDAVFWAITATEHAPDDWLNHLELGKALGLGHLPARATAAIDRAEQLFKGEESFRKVIATARAAVDRLR